MGKRQPKENNFPRSGLGGADERLGGTRKKSRELDKCKGGGDYRDEGGNLVGGFGTQQGLTRQGPGAERPQEKNFWSGTFRTGGKPWPHKHLSEQMAANEAS